MTDGNYRLFIHTSERLIDPGYVKDLTDLGITEFVAKGSVAVAYCFGECVLTWGTLEEMEQLQEALEAKGHQSRIDYRDKPRLGPSIFEYEEESDEEEDDVL
jgi:hypothetical protein